METVRFASLLCIFFVCYIGVVASNVAFKVQYTTNTTITTFQEVLKFDNVLFDTYESYNPDTGIFTAPVRGVYLFSVLLQSIGDTDGDFFIRRNDVFEAHMTIWDWKDSREMTTIAQVDEGDEIHVGRGYGNFANIRGGMDFTQFSGAMIMTAET